MVMARDKSFQDLFIYMNGIFVGKLTREYTGRLVFAYDEGWLAFENTRPISLSLPLTEIPYKGNVVDSFFDNLLPDSELIRERIQARFGAASKKPFDLLTFTGRDCIGALQILTEPVKSSVKKIQAEHITDHAIAKLLKHYQTAPLGMDKDLDFRISIAGAQEKSALLWYENKWHLPKGVTPTSHIIKLPIGHINHSGIDLSESVENEWLCLKILSGFGLPVNHARIIQFADVKTLAVERFDRHWAENKKWLMRLPQEDLCQALGIPPILKYESDGGPGIEDVMKVLLGSQDANEDRKNFMKTVFLFWVLAAIDGHAKNFSLKIEAQGRYRLAPLYDVISAYPLAANRQMDFQKLKMAMSLKSKNRHYLWNTIQPRHWIAMAERCQFSSVMMQEIINEVCDNMENVISQVTKKLPANFPPHIADSIFTGMRKVRHLCIGHKVFK